jgi:hypothetical protein
MSFFQPHPLSQEYLIGERKLMNREMDGKIDNGIYI